MTRAPMTRPRCPRESRVRRSRHAGHVDHCSADHVSGFEVGDGIVHILERSALIDDHAHVPVGHQANCALELVHQHVARADELDLLEHEARSRQREARCYGVSNCDDSPTGPDEPVRLYKCCLAADTIDDDVDTIDAPIPDDGIQDVVVARTCVQIQIEGRLDRWLGHVEANHTRPGGSSYLQRMNADSAESDDHRSGTSGYLTARDDSAVRRAQRTGEWGSMDGVDVVWHDGEPVERNDSPVTEPTGISEAGPRHGVGAEV